MSMKVIPGQTPVISQPRAKELAGTAAKALEKMGTAVQDAVMKGRSSESGRIEVDLTEAASDLVGFLSRVF